MGCKTSDCRGGWPSSKDLAENWQRPQLESKNLALAGLERDSVTSDAAKELRQTLEFQPASDAAGAAISADLDWLTSVWPLLPDDVRQSILATAQDAVNGY